MTTRDGVWGLSGRYLWEHLWASLWRIGNGLLFPSSARTPALRATPAFQELRERIGALIGSR